MIHASYVNETGHVLVACFLRRRQSAAIRPIEWRRTSSLLVDDKRCEKI